VGKLKTWTMAAALLAGTAALAAAGPGGRGQKGPERIKARVERMQENLGLSDAQARQIEDILTRAAADRQAARGDADGAREERRERMRAQHQATMDQVRAVLTDEQRAKFDQMQAERKSRHRKERSGRDDRS
jgi:Spy/CpxP family protein refolding chaperone